MILHRKKSSGPIQTLASFSSDNLKQILTASFSSSADFHFRLTSFLTSSLTVLHVRHMSVASPGHLHSFIILHSISSIIHLSSYTSGSFIEELPTISLHFAFMCVLCENWKSCWCVCVYDQRAGSNAAASQAMINWYLELKYNGHIRLI